MLRSHLRLFACALVAALSLSAARGDAAEDSLRTRLLGDLSAEAATVREKATGRLLAMEDLSPEQVAAALERAAPRAKPALFEIAASRKMTGLIPVIAAAAAGPDAQAAESAIRALVSLGPEAVAAGRTRLVAADAPDAEESDRAARLQHLTALDAQRRVETDVLGRWRRKGGSYRGRYLELAQHGWETQPVLLAMLLDVPLEDQYVVVPESGDEDLDRARKASALRMLADSHRRGYRTFDPLPANIEHEELFDLAQQALADVADLDLMQDILEDTQRELMRAHREAGWRPRPWEDGFAQDIEVILASRGAPERLEERRRTLESQVVALKRRIGRVDPEDAADEYQFYSVRLSELAGVLHQLRKYGQAAECYAEVIEVIKSLTGSEPSITGYNRACALARAGKRKAALDQLARALDPEISSGSEDLTREWVTEDGDLQPLRQDARFAEIIARRFGDAR